MAKSRKSKKTTDPVKQSVDTEKDASKSGAMPEDLDAPVPGADTSEALEAETISDHATASAKEPELSVEEALEATDQEVFGDDVAGTDASATNSEDASAVTDATDKVVDAEASDMPYEEALKATDAEIFEDADASEAEIGTDKDEAPETMDAAPEVKPEPEAKAATTPVAPPQQRSGSMWPAVFGGIIAALLGFIAGRGDQIDQYLPLSMQRGSVDLTALEADAAQLSEQTAQLTDQTAQLTDQTVAQQARIDALEAAVAATPEVVAVDPSDDIATLEATIAMLTERLAAVESRPVVDIDAAPAEVVESLQTALDAQNAQIAELAQRAADAEAKAAGEAARILARAALTRVVTAVDSGQSFAPALSDLENVTPVEVPEPLKAAADAGVPTLAALQESFPDAARAGLSAARSDVPESDVAGIGGFLKRQLNVRSVIPREGDDPDAVLSRVQAAVKTGDLTTALAEIGALPESARAAMSEWVEAAEARKAAQDAARDLADSLNSN